MTVVRLVAPPDAIADRLRRRDTGEILQGHLEEVEPLAEATAEAQLEDAVVANHERPVPEVATEALRPAGWI